MENKSVEKWNIELYNRGEYITSIGCGSLLEARLLIPETNNIFTFEDIQLKIRDYTIDMNVKTIILNGSKL